jgi:hypothetical protein
MKPYYTVVLHYVAPEHATCWHPTDAAGPLSTLTRGAFATEDAAWFWVASVVGRYDGIDVMEVR